MSKSLNDAIPESVVAPFAFEPEMPPSKPKIDEDYLIAAWSGVNPIFRQEPYAPTSGMETYKYLATANFPIVKIAMDLRLAGVFWGGWNIQTSNDYVRNPEFEELDGSCIADMRRQIDGFYYTTFQNALKSILWNAWTFGFVTAEKDFTRTSNSGWSMVAIKSKYSYYSNLWVDPADNLRAIQYTASGQFQSDEDLSKYIIAAYPFLINGQHYGWSEMRAIFQDVKLSILLEEAIAQSGNSLAVRPILHFYNKVGMRKGELERVREVLLNARSSSVISLPTGVQPNPEIKDGSLVKTHEVRVLEDRASPEGLKQTVEMLKLVHTRITRTLGVPDNLGFTTSAIGSWAKAKEEVDMFIAKIRQDQEFLCDVVNKQIIPDMLQYNWQNTPEGYKWPKFVFESIEEKHFETMASAIAILIDKGIVNREEPWIREILDIPPAEAKEVIEEI